MIEATTRYQLKVHEIGSGNGESYYDNPFGRPPRAQHVLAQAQQHVLAKEDPRWEMNFHEEFPKLHGSLMLADFLYWLNIVDKVFECYEVLESKKVKLGSLKFRWRVSFLWEQYQMLFM